jgi:hypothetical protein
MFAPGSATEHRFLFEVSQGYPLPASWNMNITLVQLAVPSRFSKQWPLTREELSVIARVPTPRYILKLQVCDACDATYPSHVA